MIPIDAIDSFSCPTLRKEIIAEIVNSRIPPSYFTDSVFGAQWRRVNQIYRDAVDSLCPVSFQMYEIVPFSAHHQIVYYNRDGVVHTEPLWYE